VADGPQGVVDLRSDTVTRPTAAMRTAMAEAEVGDDVYGEDPTLNALQDEVAALLGHEAALFTPTGTMANQISVALTVPRGDEMLCDADAHIVNYEAGAAAAVGGISTRTWSPAGAALDPDVILSMVRSEGYHTVPTRTVAVELTHNRAGGAVIPFGTLQRLREVADEHGLRLHCDGARLWNAHVADGIALADYGRLFDTVSVCLSKGLGAPVGSLLISTAERIGAAVELRHRLGGAMRQAGILAAAGRYALAHHVERLADDHRRARRLAEAFEGFGLVDAGNVRTNIVPLDLADAPVDAATLRTAAAAEGVLVSVMGPRFVRLVTHLDVDDAGIEHAIQVLSAALK
jgi:threonine aldolase